MKHSKGKSLVEHYKEQVAQKRYPADTIRNDISHDILEKGKIARKTRRAEKLEDEYKHGSKAKHDLSYIIGGKHADRRHKLYRKSQYLADKYADRAGAGLDKRLMSEEYRSKLYREAAAAREKKKEAKILNKAERIKVFKKVGDVMKKERFGENNE